MDGRRVSGYCDDDLRVVVDCRWRSARRCSGCVRAGARIGARLVSQAILRSTATCMLLI